MNELLAGRKIPNIQGTLCALVHRAAYLGKDHARRSGVRNSVKKGLKTERLDGENVRQLFPHTEFTKEERDRHIRMVGHLASMLEEKIMN